ncbi:prephenate dehydrogenase/arogenate dehydrogenase family protein [Thermodesulforhabdus norvegica]|uniref:Prephenate dehydrogenase n=1 Tax=Thermodesulforhabdus norvegica TaxID=39841 RepID=A0A1I4U9K4_9BACT|nr:prephenate dehydrogenase/arogenate dehydrogenase family protein [Thermodesulforhabdus norvegica]SFM85686.1 prephenate dehydrogenase [Thermodesulforhabdus norvegica]
MTGYNGNWAPGSCVGIIGGLGEMGQFFARLFSKRGYRVLVSDVVLKKNHVGTPVSSEEIFQQSDIVLFSVPLHRTVEIIESYAPRFGKDQLVMDVSSLKVQPIKAMLKGVASVVGLHPMFGGSVRNACGQTLVACPVRVDREGWLVVKEQFLREGLKVVECSPEHHDRMMAVIQVLFHLCTMLKGRVIREMGIDIEETLRFTSPVYRLEISILGRMFAQNPWLYAAISQLNPHTGEIIDHLLEGLSLFREYYRKGALEKFVEEFRDTATHLGDFCNRAFEESSQLVEISTRLYDDPICGARDTERALPE